MRFLQVLGAVALIGCGGASDEATLTATGTGMAEVSIPLEISEITSVVATVTAPDISGAIIANLAIVNDRATGLIAGIPAGVDRSFSVEAYVGAVLVCTGAQLVEIIADTRVTVSLVLDCSVPPPAAGEAEVVADFNFPPEIVSVTATPSPVVVGGTVDLVVTATDPNASDVLTYDWTATDGTFSVTDAATTVWTAPAVDGSYEITVTVSDGTTSVSLTIIIVVIL